LDRLRETLRIDDEVDGGENEYMAINNDGQ
jgi:hypothetical protein